MLDGIFNNDPLKEYYNLENLQKVILTCDVDWAPEYAIESVLQLISEYGFKINVFSTHKSEILLKKYPNVEVGIHPDFTRPDQHDWFDKKIFNLMNIYPGSEGMRAHRNFFGQNIGDLAHAAGLKYDVSVFLWNEAFCQAHQDYNGLVRFSYMWEDGIHLDTNTPFTLEAVNFMSPGLKILNIHPILFYLNSVNEDHRRSVTKKYKDLTLAPKKEIDECVNKSFGIRKYYESLLDYMKDKNIETEFLSVLTNKKLNGNYEKAI